MVQAGSRGHRLDGRHRRPASERLVSSAAVRYRALLERPRVMVQRPMALVVIGVLFVMALITPSAIAYWFFYALAVLVGVSYLWTRSAANNIRIRRTLLTKWATTGDVIEEEFLLSNLGRLPVLLVELEDHSTLPGYTASVAENLDGRQTKRWTGRGTALRRGLFSLGPRSVTQ